MKKFLGFCPQQYGDLVHCTVAARILKLVEPPDSHFTLAIAGDYREIAPLFLDHPYIDSIHILDKPRDGFNQIDLDWINKQDFYYVFNPMQDHDHRNPWFLSRHQCLEMAHMHRLPLLNDDGSCYLNKWFNVNYDPRLIAFAPFAGSYGPNNKKMLSIENAQKIVDLIIGLGYNVLQLGAPSEVTLKGAVKLDQDYFSSVRAMLGCKLLIHTDTGLGWVASAYKMPAIGLYSNEYYGREYVKNIQPVNRYAIYLDDNNVNNIPISSIEESINKIL